MARYKPDDVDQGQFIPVSFRDQILPGSFEYAFDEIVEQHLELTPFEARSTNDDSGRWADDPAVLLKIVWSGDDKGIVSSRRLAEAGERHVQVMALSADARPHCTTIADFVAQMHQEVAGGFTDVWLYASELNLIGRDPCAIDGGKLPGNASKQWSGTHQELRRKQKKLEAAAKQIVARTRHKMPRRRAPRSSPRKRSHAPPTSARSTRSSAV